MYKLLEVRIFQSPLEDSFHLIACTNVVRNVRGKKQLTSIASVDFDIVVREIAGPHMVAAISVTQ